jgi:reverse transcriptase-like protein
MKRSNRTGKLGTAAHDATAVTADLAGAAANGPEGLLDWDVIDWRHQERQVERLQQRIFKAEQAGDRKQVRNLQKLTAPRGALLYPRLSREEFEGRFLGLMPYLELKGEGNHSMAEN